MGKKRHAFFRLALVGWIGLTVIASSPILNGARPLLRPPRRAIPPTFSKSDKAIFFKEATKQLAGKRPDYQQKKRNLMKGAEGAFVKNSSEEKSNFAWAKYVSAETLENEIKRHNQKIPSLVQTQNAFKSGGYRKCRTEFTMLAVLFGVVGEHEESVRWQRLAPGLRDLYGRAGKNCKVGTDQSYKEAKLRQEDLAALVRGSKPNVNKADKLTEWHQIADRAPLMKVMQELQQKKLKLWLSNKKEFKKHSDEIIHHAELLAMLAQVIADENYEYGDDEEYQADVTLLQSASQEISQAVKNDMFDKARTAFGNSMKSCSNCHDNFRG